MNIWAHGVVVKLKGLDIKYAIGKTPTPERYHPVTITALLVCLQSFGVAVSAEEFPEIVKRLCEAENARAAIYVEGTFDVPLPNTVQDISRTFSGVVARDGRYTLAESAMWGSTQYWYDSDATYIGKEKVLEVDKPEARAALAVFLGNMLNPATSTTAKLLQGAKAIETVDEKDATAEISGRYEYLLSYEEESPDIRLILTIRAEGGLSELRISEVNGYPLDAVYTFGSYISLGADTVVPQEYEHRLEGITGASKASGPTTLMRIKFTEVSPAPADAAFAPDRAEFSEVHDYRKGLRGAQRATGEWLDGVKDYLGF